MPSPVRRSARGAASASRQSPPSSDSSASLLASTRQERLTRANNTAQKSATPHSLSSEEVSEPPRRGQRAQNVKAEEPAQVDADADVDVDDAVGEEEEVTRCVCGQAEYPGPPLSDVLGAAGPDSEDAGGLFIQCDGCGVWQHGGCVGIMEENQSPEKYYCEECRPKLHELRTDSRGQRYSLYGPVQQKHMRKQSLSKSDEKMKRERDATASRASADPSTGKRRATMRSKEHDDEEEQLRRALEESKRDAGLPANGRRNGKRGRDDSDGTKQDSKRQRTASESLTSATRTASLDDESDEEAAIAGKSKRAKVEAAQSARHAELREKEKEREKARAEAAGRRQERAGRRRADDPEPPEDTPKPGVSAKSSAPASPQQPSPPAFAVPERVAYRKLPGKPKKKLGNNQYTKLREQSTQPPTSSPHSKKRQLANQTSGSGDEGSAGNGTSNGINKNSPSGQEAGNGKPSKLGKGKHGKGSNGAKAGDEVPERTFPNMKRAVDGMLSWIQRQQIEMAGDRTPPGADLTRLHVQDTSVAAGGAVQPPNVSAPLPMRAWEKLSSMEMADVLAQECTQWNERWGERN